MWSLRSLKTPHTLSFLITAVFKYTNPEVTSWEEEQNLVWVCFNDLKKKKTTVFNQKGKIFSDANKGLIMVFSSSKCGRMLSAYRLILFTAEAEQIQWLCLNISLSEIAKAIDERVDESLYQINRLFASKSQGGYSNATFLKGADIAWLVLKLWSNSRISI